MRNGNEVITGDLPSGFRDDHLRLEFVKLSPEVFVLKGDLATDWFKTFCNKRKDFVQFPFSKSLVLSHIQKDESLYFRFFKFRRTNIEI